MDDGSGFKAGDVVQLKSGGPLMTVAAIKDYGVVSKWFGDDGKFHEDTSRPELLRLVKMNYDEPHLQVL